MASRSFANIGSGKEVMFFAWRHQAICWNNADLFSLMTLHIQNTNVPFNE